MIRSRLGAPLTRSSSCVQSRTPPVPGRQRAGSRDGGALHGGLHELDVVAALVHHGRGWLGEHAVDGDLVALGEDLRPGLAAVLAERLVVAVRGDEHLAVGDGRRDELGEEPEPVARARLLARPERPA